MNGRFTIPPAVGVKAQPAKTRRNENRGWQIGAQAQKGALSFVFRCPIGSVF